MIDAPCIRASRGSNSTNSSIRSTNKPRSVCCSLSAIPVFYPLHALSSTMQTVPSPCSASSVTFCVSPRTVCHGCKHACFSDLIETVAAISEGFCTSLRANIFQKRDLPRIDVFSCTCLWIGPRISTSRAGNHWKTLLSSHDDTGCMLS